MCWSLGLFSTNCDCDTREDRWASKSAHEPMHSQILLIWQIDLLEPHPLPVIAAHDAHMKDLLKLSHQHIPVDDMYDWRQLLQRGASQKHQGQVQIAEFRERQSIITNYVRKKRIKKRKKEKWLKRKRVIAGGQRREEQPELSSGWAAHKVSRWASA